MILFLSKALVYTAVFSLLSAPFDFKMARLLGAIDTPHDGRRMHETPTPRLGGFSIFLSFVLSFVFFSKAILTPYLPFVAGAFLIVILGIFDDSIGLSPTVKLICQSFISLLAVLGINTASPSLGVFGVLLMLTFINAHNFIDGLDLLCVGVSIIEATALGMIFAYIGTSSAALISLILCGACIGFYPYNRHKARLFMGDTGSTLLGYVLGTLALNLLTIEISASAICSLAAIFFVPLFDMAFAIIRRLIRKKSIFCADRSHVHHILADRFGHKKASIILRLLALLSAFCGVCIYICL